MPKSAKPPQPVARESSPRVGIYRGGKLMPTGTLLVGDTPLPSHPSLWLAPLCTISGSVVVTYINKPLYNRLVKKAERDIQERIALLLARNTRKFGARRRNKK